MEFSVEEALQTREFSPETWSLGKGRENLSAEFWTSQSCIMGGSNKGNSNLSLRKRRPREKICHFLCGWNYFKEDSGLLIKRETILKEVHLPPFNIFSGYTLQIFCTWIFLPIITKLKAQCTKFRWVCVWGGVPSAQSLPSYSLGPPRGP